MNFVPEGQHDRSLARSAWESVLRENRPVGYGMIGRIYPRHFKGIPRRKRTPSCRIRNSITPIIVSVLTPERIRPYPTERLFWVALSLAPRARLRSHRPSGTKAIRPSKGLTLSLALMVVNPGPAFLALGDRDWT
jgi:hypothetical protein